MPGIAALAQGFLRQGGGGSGAGDEDGVGLGGDELQDLAGDAGVGAGVFLGGDDADVLGLEGAGGLGEPAVAVGVVEADEADGLHAGLGHVVGDGVGHEAVVLGCLEDPVAGGVHGLDQAGAGGERDHGDLLLGGDVDEGEGGGGGAAADEGVDGVLVDELAGVGDGLGAVGGVVEDDPLDLLAADLGGQEGDGVALRDAEACGRAGGGDGDADLDLGPCDGRGHGRGCEKQECEAAAHGRDPHLFLWGKWYGPVPGRVKNTACDDGTVARWNG